MALRTKDEDIWFWYNKVLEQKRSPLRNRDFCKKHGLEYKKFGNMKYRILFIKDSRPVLYESLLDLARRLNNSGMGIGEFCKMHNADPGVISEARTHLKYLEAIKRLTPKPEVKPEQDSVFIEPNTEKFNQDEMVVDKNDVGATSQTLQKVWKWSPMTIKPPRNNLEIRVTEDIKIIVSHKLDSRKIMEIIDFLKIY
jgi:hypothetical protein